jgi:hypothetical protein
MGSIGIDFVALAIVGAALVLGQIRQIPAAVRYFIMAAAFAIVAVYRLNQGFRDNFNLVVVGLCVVFAVQNVVKGLRYRGPSSDS